MGEPFFNKLNTLTSGVKKDVDFIKHSIGQPKHLIPSHVGARKMRDIEDHVKSLVNNLESDYNELQNHLEVCSSSRTDRIKKLEEMEKNLDLIEQRFATKGYVPWREEAATVPKTFISPMAVSSGNSIEQCKFTPIMATPRTHTLASSSAIVSSTPMDLCELHVPRQLYEQSKIHYGGFANDTTQMLGELGAVRKSKIGTPEEPVLYSRRFNLHGTNTTPEEPTLTNVFTACGSVAFDSSQKKNTPEEPILQSSNLQVRKKTPEEPLLQSLNLPRPVTPPEPVLTSKRFAKF